MASGVLRANDAQLSILAPGVAMVAWTFGMQGWMYAVRLPAISKHKLPMKPDSAKEDMQTLPAEVKWKAENYNHLHEQPTLFYFVIAATALINAGSAKTASLDTTNKIAWAYVASRVTHSLVQVMTNVIPMRFATFQLSNVALAALTYRLGKIVFA